MKKPVFCAILMMTGSLQPLVGSGADQGTVAQSPSIPMVYNFIRWETRESYQQSRTIAVITGWLLRGVEQEFWHNTFRYDPNLWAGPVASFEFWTQRHGSRTVNYYSVKKAIPYQNSRQVWHDGSPGWWLDRWVSGGYASFDVIKVGREASKWREIASFAWDGQNILPLLSMDGMAIWRRPSITHPRLWMAPVLRASPNLTYFSLENGIPQPLDKISGGNSPYPGGSERIDCTAIFNSALTQMVSEGDFEQAVDLLKERLTAMGYIFVPS